MVAANAVTAIYLAGKTFPSLRRVLRDPERWERIVQLAAELKEQLPAAPDAVALEGFLTRRRAAAPEKFPDLSLSVIKLIGRGEYALDSTRRRSSRTFRAGGERLHAFHCAEPSLSRSHHATASVSRAGWSAAALHHPGTDGTCEALHRSGRRRHQSRTPGRQVCRCVAAIGKDRPAIRRHRHRRSGQRHLGPASSAANRRPAYARFPRS